MSTCNIRLYFANFNGSVRYWATPNGAFLVPFERLPEDVTTKMAILHIAEINTHIEGVGRRTAFAYDLEGVDDSIFKLEDYDDPDAT